MRSLAARMKPQPEPGQATTIEQMKEVVDLASEFDRLQGLPIWEKIVLHMGTEVQSELMEATQFKWEPARAQIHTCRWDAKRELLDNTLGWIAATQKERDRLIHEFREQKEVS